MEAFKRPGFGWSSYSSSAAGTAVSVIDGKSLSETVSSLDYPGEFLNEHMEIKVDIGAVRDAIESAFASYFLNHDNELDRVEFYECGKSRGNFLKWSLMKIAPNYAFKLHAHRNVELICVIEGNLHEYRYQVSSVKLLPKYNLLYFYYL